MDETAAIMKWWLKRAARKEPKTNLRGEIILSHGAPMYILSFTLFAAGIFCVILGLFFLDTRDPRNAPEYGIAIVSFFLLAGGWALLEAIRGRVLLANDGIIVKSTWSGQSKKILWSEVEYVSYSHLSTYFTIKSLNGTKVRFNGYLYGIQRLVKEIEFQLSPMMYSKAQMFIDEIHEVSKPGISK